MADSKFKKPVPANRTVVPGRWSDLLDDESVAVEPDGNTAAYRMMMLPYPPLNVPNRSLPFVKRMSVNGDGVTTSLSVDGSASPVEAFVLAPAEGDLYIRLSSVIIADAGAISLNSFGSIIGGLSVGCTVFTESAGVVTNQDLSLKTNFDFIRIGTKTAGTGGKIDAYQLAKTDPSNDDGYHILLDATEVSMFGIRLLKGTQDKFGIRINDDLSGVATFDIIVKGFIRT